MTKSSLTQSMLSAAWAATPEMVDMVIALALNESRRMDLHVDALERMSGTPMMGTDRVSIRNGVAIVPIRGPLSRYGMGWFSRSTYETLAKDFAIAVNDPSIKAIVLNVDSPGGEVNGTAELADMIFQARGSKPIVAYVGGYGASAAYWLASAADKIVMDATAMVGSIGVLTTYVDWSKYDEKMGLREYTIVSSQSPYKADTPATDGGKKRIQAMVDDLASVFVSRIAQYRGVDESTVLKNYGKGDVIVGQAAVDAGIADEIGSLEGVIASLSGRGNGLQGMPAAGGRNTTLEGTMSNQNPSANTEQTPQITAEMIRKDHAAVAQQLSAEASQTAKVEAVATERARVQAILGHEEAGGREELAKTLAFTTDMAPEAAAAILASAPKAAARSAGNALAAAMEAVGNPAVGADAGAGENGELDAVAQVLASAKAAGLNVI